MWNSVTYDMSHIDGVTYHMVRFHKVTYGENSDGEKFALYHTVNDHMTLSDIFHMA